MEFVFTPTENGLSGLDVPYIEDARASIAPYYRSAIKLSMAMSEVSSELAKLGALAPLIQDGYFNVGKTKRYGYIVTFQYGGGRGVIRVAGLPIKLGETNHKIEQVRRQALLIVRDWLKAAVTAKIFNPGSDPLIPYMLVNGEQTVTDYIHSMQRLPEIAAPKIIEGEIVEMQKPLL